jgi:hypothetical protein
MMGSLFRWLFRNRQTGGITVAQFPNTALWIVDQTPEATGIPNWPTPSVN